jgi:AraC-like DNA-binding protein
VSFSKRSSARGNAKLPTEERFWRLQRLVKDYFTLLSTACRQCQRRIGVEKASNLKALREALEEDDSALGPDSGERVGIDWECLAHEAGFRLGKMAVLRGVSQRHLQRIFKRQFRCCPRKWLRELRCQEARRLIAQGYSSKAAAAELNFATGAHFCREFKRVFGVSPQRFAPRSPELVNPARQARTCRPEPRS